MFENLRGKRLLVVGGSDRHDESIIDTAHELGIYVISVDGNEADTAKYPAKNKSDEVWTVDYTKTEVISKLCKANNVDGVIAGYSEDRVLAASRIAKAIQTPFYATEEQIVQTRNKRTFKDICKLCDIPVPNDFVYSLPISSNDKSMIKYPVIVKPVDYAGCKGITVCHSQDDLENAVNFAMNFTKCGNIIVEEYLEGTEMAAIYTIVNGDISLSALNDKYLTKDGANGTKPGLCNLVLSPSKNYSHYISTLDGKIKKFLTHIGVSNGVAFFQLIEKDNHFSVFEMGLRINGNNDFKTIEELNGINFLKMLISYSLTGDMGDTISKDNPEYKKYVATLVMQCHEGTVGKIDYSSIVNQKGIENIYPWVQPGQKIVNDGSTQQHGMSVVMTTDSLSEMIEIIDTVQMTVIIDDINGENLLFKSFNTQNLL